MQQKESKYAENIQHVLSLRNVEGIYPAPIDLNIKNKSDIELPELQWNHYQDKPYKMKINNIRSTVVLRAKWKNKIPFISSGPLDDNYTFSQLHFHWGDNDNEGSEHSVEGHCFPMELHAVYYKGSNTTKNYAHESNDGVVVLVYLFTIQENNNENLSPVIEALPSVCVPNSSTCIPPSSLEDFAPSFQNNYFVYWGTMTSMACTHEILWFICRESIGISRSQLYKFRKLKGPDHQLINHVFYGIQPLQNRSFLLVNGLPPLERTLMHPMMISHSQSAQKRSYTTGALPQSAENFNTIKDDLVDIIPHAYEYKEKLSCFKRKADDCVM